MRLWHKDLIPVLPRQQLLGQWREVFAIYRDYKRELKGESKKSAYAHLHPLVKYVNDFDVVHLLSYAKLIYEEMMRRGYKANQSLLDEVYTELPLDSSEIYKEIHTDDYYFICLYNLKEKYIRGMISIEEWVKIENLRLK